MAHPVVEELGDDLLSGEFFLLQLRVVVESLREVALGIAADLLHLRRKCDEASGEAADIFERDDTGFVKL
jgi:hypothetical protein